MDEKLTWKDHISRVKGKLSKSLAVIKNVRNLLDEKSLLSLYYALFFPYINYCLEVWGSTYVTNVKSIFLLQKQLIRIICNKHYLESTNSLFGKLKIVKFFDLLELKICTIIHKAIKYDLPQPLLKLIDLQKNIHYNTRSCEIFLHKSARTKLKSMCISVTGVRLYNNLNIEVKSCKHIRKFIKTFKHYKIEGYNAPT